MKNYFKPPGPYLILYLIGTFFISAPSLAQNEESFEEDLYENESRYRVRILKEEERLPVIKEKAPFKKRHFFAVGFFSPFCVASVISEASKIYALVPEIAYWYERDNYRLGVQLGLGALHYRYDKDTFSFLYSIGFESYYLTKGNTSFYIGGGFALTGFSAALYFPCPTLVAGMGIEFFRKTGHRLSIGVKAVLPVLVFPSVHIGPQIQLMF